FLPIKQINNSALLAVNGVANVSVAGNGQHANPTTINAWFANSLNSAPGTVLFGEAWLGANGVVINGSAVQAFPPTGRRDTFAHEVGHNLGLGHADFGAGASNN
ncbi:MAG: zinc-dependent metalloprotease family protein, partial [Pirellulaceae bacterium]